MNPQRPPKPPVRRPPQDPHLTQRRSSAQGPRPPLTPAQRRRAEAARRRRRAALRRRRAVALMLLLALLALAAWGLTALLGGGRDAQDGSSSGAADAGGSSLSAQTGGSSSPAGSSPLDAAADSSAAKTAAQGEEDWQMRLVNHTHPLPDGFTVETSALPNGLEFDSRAIGQLEQMLADGNATGLQLMVCSAYRSVERQDELFNEMLQDYIAEGYSEEEAYAITATIRTPHGCSEHSTGLAADIVAVDYQMLDDGYAETDEAKWLLENAADYGFILRYPKDKESVTGIIWEPWHYRYVGVENAKKIKESGLCLEEYLEANGA